MAEQAANATMLRRDEWRGIDPHAGHAVYAERPDAFFAEVEAFLAGPPRPVAPLTGTPEPAGYRGPAWAGANRRGTPDSSGRPRT